MCIRDRAYTLAWMLAAEPAAKLLNFSILALLAWLLYDLARTRLPGWMAATLMAGFVSTPLTQLVTGSMFVENFLAAMLLGVGQQIDQRGGDQVAVAEQFALASDRDRQLVKSEFAYQPRYIQRHTLITCLLYTSPSPRDRTRSRMPSSA